MDLACSATPSSSASTSAAPVAQEHMFDKVVTPSDVGKLNRLVIPKQHAERYFPLDTSANDKGLLLNFEDRTGKPWRFRYSYWNSSQSYVMTKGWSRFVKEKKLDAGDTVSFSRAVDDKNRLFIDWKRRPEVMLHGPPRFPRVPLPLLPPPPPGSTYPPMLSFARPVGAAPWAGRLLVPTSQNYLCNVAGGAAAAAVANGGSGQYLVYRSAVAPPQLTAGVPMVLDSVPLTQRQTAAKRVRLFGVNLDSPDSDGDAGRSSRASSPSSSSPFPSPEGKEKRTKEEPSLDLEM